VPSSGGRTFSSPTSRPETSDSTTGDEILKLLFDLHRDHGVTLIIATHDPRVAERCQSIVRVKDGVVVAGPHPHGGQVTAPVRP
jgi:predicted ABC-type transport system involved in lysophospholipase L1 biosynthesis ATPase subunit